MAIHYSTVIEAEVTMRISQFSLLIFYLLFLYCHALNCRSDGGPKEMELKKIYNRCIKQQEGGNKNNSPGDSDRDWRESGGRHQWSQDNMARNREHDNKDNRMGNRDNQNGENRDKISDKNKIRGQDRNSNNRDNRMENRRDENEASYRRDRGEDGQGRNDNNRQEKNYGVSNRNDFFPNDDYSGYSSQYANQPSRRYKRERRVEMNSGKRSQYNPNPQRFSGYEESYGSEENNSSDNSNTNNDIKACALHCLLENLQMTGQNDMPDRYLVTHTITKDIKDEDLKDFLQESIDECFQLLDNENIEDKCEFSKNLLMCLSEKGRANCDDWKDDFQF